MSDYLRYAIYYLPPSGALADFGAHWLGWDNVTGQPCKQASVRNIDQITKKPRKYGFHATLKAPFRLVADADVEELKLAVGDLAADIKPAVSDGLELTVPGRFLALTSVGDSSAINHLANRCVMELDRFRAPTHQAELDQRRMGSLRPGQKEMLQRWGYPYVLDFFRFHMTLTAKMSPQSIIESQQTIQKLCPPLPVPFVIDHISLVGERSDGGFQEIRRYALRGI